MPANEKRRYVMTLDLRQYIAEYTVANFWRYPIRHLVTYASALELLLFCSFNPVGLDRPTYVWDAQQNFNEISKSMSKNTQFDLFK